MTEKRKTERISEHSNEERSVAQILSIYGKDIKDSVYQDDTFTNDMPQVQTGGQDLALDMKMGWKPKLMQGSSGAPIPLYYEFDQYEHLEYDSEKPIIYMGPRAANSLLVHQLFARK